MIVGAQKKGTLPFFLRSLGEVLMSYLMQFVDLFMHLDKYLGAIISQYGVWTYAILFVVVFCETGLVVTPLLPGDSLLFAAGAFASRGSLDLSTLIFLLIIAAVLGDAVNYHIGKMIGPRAFNKTDARFLRREYLERTRRFYERYGGKTIILARFVPIVRTFAPFLAGIGIMSYRRFALYNVSGGVAWVTLFAGAGFFFSGLPVVKNNFTLVILAIVVISVMPALYEYFNSRRANAA